ncbi:hypothetical protein Pflav_086570 [Phytohabitans flavus]|uniref:FAD dependent oxidoreductase domain-containing protein n=1 Tax=Phytohabitans flavus TaxID=1076124 RepID=A0A6F8Y855_9ACTN|nr:hypothetical protein Pflav_086570 [Phytohabitans flavus]
MPERADVVIVGAGHNGLVSAVLLARAGLDVVVLEAADVLGGAARTEHPFPRVPGLGQSTGSYLLGLMPPELLKTLDVDIPVLRRDPHYFLPTRGDAYLLFGSDREATRAQMMRFFSPEDVGADDAMQAEIGALRDDLAPRGWPSHCPSRRPRSATSGRRSRRLSSTWYAVRSPTTWPASTSGRSCSSPCTWSPTASPASTPARTTPAPATTSWCTTCAGSPARTAPG